MDHAQPCAPGVWAGVMGNDGMSVRDEPGFRLQILVEALPIGPTAIDDTQSAECVALELRVALQALGEIVGTVTNEDISDQIFQDFCIGK